MKSNARGEESWERRAILGGIVASGEEGRGKREVYRRNEKVEAVVVGIFNGRVPASLIILQDYAFNDTLKSD